MVKRFAKLRRLSSGNELLRQRRRDGVGLSLDPLPRRKHRGQQNLVGIAETGREIVHESRGARDLMRLKGAPDTACAEHFARGLQRRLDRRGMMGVVVDHRDAPPLPHEFESPTNAAEIPETVPNVAG